MTVPTGPGESPRRLNDDGIGFWFDPLDGSERVSLGGLVGDIRVGDTVELYPLLDDGTTKGYVVVHRPERDNAAGQVLDPAPRGETYVEIPYPADMSERTYPIPDEEVTPDYRAGYADGLADRGESAGVTSAGALDGAQRLSATLRRAGLIAGTTADDESDDEPEIGPVERALTADLRTLKPGGQLSRTLIASALTLARALDNAPADKIASIGKELREHVKRIEETAGADDDTRDHTTNLSTPV